MFLLLLLLSPPGDGLAALPSSIRLRPRVATAEGATDAPQQAVRPRSSAPLLVAAATASSAGAGDEPAASSSPLARWLVANRSLLLLVCLVVHKCSTDGLTRYTRVRGAYSGSTVAIMSEVFKFPLIATAIAGFGGGVREVLPTFRDAFSRKPFALSLIHI